MCFWCTPQASVSSEFGVVCPSLLRVYCSIKHSLYSNEWVKAQFQAELWFPVFHFLVFNRSCFLFLCFIFALNSPHWVLVTPPSGYQSRCVSLKPIWQNIYFCFFVLCWLSFTCIYVASKSHASLVFKLPVSSLLF